MFYWWKKKIYFSYLYWDSILLWPVFTAEHTDEIKVLNKRECLFWVFVLPLLITVHRDSWVTDWTVCSVKTPTSCLISARSTVWLYGLSLWPSWMALFQKSFLFLLKRTTIVFAIFGQWQSARHQSWADIRFALELKTFESFKLKSNNKSHSLVKPFHTSSSFRFDSELANKWKLNLKRNPLLNKQNWVNYRREQVNRLDA